jgi:hypothetical protein
MQICTWKAEGLSKEQVRELVKVDFPNLVTFLQPNKAEDNTNVDVFLLEELNQGKDGAPITMPITALTSYAGQLVTVKHFVRIEVVTGRCVTNPELTIAVEVGCEQSSTMPTGTATSSTEIQPPVGATSAPIPTADTVKLGGGSSSASNAASKTPSTSTSPPSLKVLLQDIDDSLQDEQIIQAKLIDQAWTSAAFFDKMSPQDYGSVVQQISSDFEQPSVAERLARQIRSFSCAHCVAALRCTTEWNRGSVLEKLLPYCTDISTNHTLSELTDWEKMVGETVLESALKKPA